MDERTQVNTRRQRATRAVRTIVGLVGVGAAVATVLVAGRLDLPDIGSAPSAATIEPVPAAQSRACSGPLMELGQDAAAATAATSVGSPIVVAGEGLDGAVASTPLAAPDDTAGATGPALLSAPATEDESTLAGAQSQAVERDRMRGYAASACAEPVSDAWLVAGSSDVGQSTVVNLVNPSAVEASVTLEVFGETGRVDAPAAAGIVVEPGTQRIVALAGIAPNLQTPVVHMSSIGAAVVATLQQSAVRAITAEGVDVVGSTSSPAAEQTIAGFVVPLTRPVERSEGYDWRVPGVRLLVPGSFDSQVTIVATRTDGTTSAPQTVDATAGAVIDVPVSDLAPGEYSITVTSSEPVVAAAHTASLRSDRSDFAWFVSTVPLDDTATVSVVNGPSPALHLVNASGEERTVVVAWNGGERSVIVPAGGSTVQRIESRRTYVLSDVAGMHAAITYIGDAGIASFAVAPPSAASDPVVVRTR
jgi:hypothetical protein